MSGELDRHPDALYTAAGHARQSDRLAAAAELLTADLRHRPAHGWAWYLYGDARRGLGLRLESERALLRALDLLDDRFWPTVRLGQLCKAFGDHEDAERWCSRATALSRCQEHGWVWTIRGVSLVVRHL